MTSQSRNALGDAYLQSVAGFDAACDIKELLDIWSTRQPLNVPPGGQAELRNVFRDAHRFLSQAEQKFEQALSAQIEQRVMENGQSGGSRYRRKLATRSGAL